MSNIQIPNLSPAVALNGTEQYEGVQAGSSVRISTAQIAAYINTSYPPPGVSSISTSGPITGGTITSSGTIGLAGASVSNSYLSGMAARTLKGNATANPATPSDISVSTALDMISDTRGTVLYRDASSWQALAPGAAGQFLQTQGGGADPTWATVGSSSTPLFYQQGMVDTSVRSTGGGVGVAAQVATGGYTQFMRTAKGLNNRIIGAYYRGTTHGQDDPEGICLYQPGISGVPLVIDGNAASGGEVVMTAPTRFSLTSSYNLSYGTVTFYGDITIAGVPAASYTMTGPNNGRVFSPGTVRATRITGVTCNFDTIGDIAAGLYATPANTEVRYSDDGGKTWPLAATPVPGLISGTERGYQTALLASRTGTVVLLVYKTDLITGVSSTVRFASADNGITYGPAQSVTFTGLTGTDTRFTLYSPWRQLADGSFASIGANGENSYWARTTDGSVIDCTLMAVTDYAAANTNSWQITGINSGTKTITLASSLGDVTTYFPANMSVTIAGSGGADGATYVTSSSWDGTNTLVVVNALSAGTIGASSRLRQTYGPAQILSANLGTNSIELMYDQRANFIAGHYFGVSGSSGGGNQNVDGVHKITSVAYDAPTNRTTLVLSLPLPGATVAPQTRTTNLTMGEYGFDCLTDLTWAACPRPNSQLSKLPIFTTNDGGVTTVYQGQTNVTEGARVSMTLDFMDNGGVKETVIGGYERGVVDSFFLVCAPASDLLTTQQNFTAPYYWLATGGAFPNSGYPSNTVFGNTLVITYGIEDGLNLAHLECRRVLPPFPSFATTATNTFTGVQLIPDGAIGAPAIGFSEDPTSGLWRRGSGVIDLSISGVHRWELISGTQKMGSAGVYGWSSTSAASGTPDTSMSRIGAGVIGAGTGSAASLAGQFYGATLRTGQTTVAGLPAAATAGAGARAYVTDANATTFLSTVAGGGANKVPVVSDGANWLIG